MTLPAGWHEAPLGEVCRVVSGATPKTDVAEYWGGPIRWVTPNDLSKDRSQVLYEGHRSLTPAGYESCSARLFPAGSVIVSSRAPVGYVAIAGEEMCTNQGCKTAIPPGFIDSKYLYWYLIAARPDLEARASGTTFKEISGKRFAETRLRWPDLDVQRRIVELLEDHLSRLDAAERSLYASARRPSALMNSVLATLHEGSLVPLGELAVRSGYGTSEKCIAGGPGPVVVRIPNLVGGSIDLSNSKRVADAGADVSKYRLRRGDLLIVRTNGSVDLIGRAAVVHDDLEAAFASYLIRYRLKEDIVRPEWVRAMLSAPQLRRQLESLAASSAGQYNLSLGKLDPLPIPVPSLDEQDARLRQLSGLTEDATRLRYAISANERRATGLRRSLLAAAFSGRLTYMPHDHLVCAV